MSPFRNSGDGITSHGPMRRSPRVGRRPVVPVAAGALMRPSLAPVRADASRRERHVQLLMSQTGAGHDIAARCLDSVGGDIAGAIMKIFDTTSTSPLPVLLGPVQRQQDTMSPVAKSISHASTSLAARDCAVGTIVDPLRRGLGYPATNTYKNLSTNFFSVPTNVADEWNRETCASQRFASLGIDVYMSALGVFMGACKRSFLSDIMFLLLLSDWVTSKRFMITL